MLSSLEFLAEPRYERLIISAPNNIDEQWRAELIVADDSYVGFGENGFMALAKAVRRFRDTDPLSPGVETFTLNMERPDA